ncbi:porin [Roseomonas sp. WA12]
MRKLLLGSTAVAAAALFAPVGASAQGVNFADGSMGAPAVSMRGLEVRVGGYFRAIYNYTDQDGSNNATTRLGKSDFSQEIEIHILASGKAANGLRYGVALEIENDAYRQPQAGNPATNVTTNGAKNTLNYDEAWAYLAGPWGQIRYGDEDGAIQQLASGHITGFGIGGLDSGDAFQQVVGGNYRIALNNPNDLGDNTKLIYMSPQFLGFDAGASFSFNTQEGPLSGCDSLANAALCDRVSALPGGSTRRRNEVQAALRWRGSFGPVGLAATVGYIGADSVKNTTFPAISGQRIDMVWAGAAVTGFGFTVGGWYTGGSANANYATLTESRTGALTDDRNVGAYLVGATYTIDAITVGGHFTQVLSAGSQTFGTGGRRETAFAVGGNYRVAPGLDFFTEYLQSQRKERNFNIATGTVGATDGINVATVLAGFRVAF